MDDTGFRLDGAGSRRYPGVMESIALIGFGEAGQAFAQAGWRAFDTADRAAEMAALGVEVAGCQRDAVARARLILSLVTADAAHGVAQGASATIEPGSLYFDMNSVAPQTKALAAAAIDAAGGHYLDVAIMAPVLPARRAVSLLVSGPEAESGVAALRTLGFTDVRAVGCDVGRASTIKMLRSVMIKGIEALTGEMMAAAERAGVADAVLASLGEGWDAKARYNLERMATHGPRRAAEMEEVAKTLESLGIEPLMTRGTIQRQRAAARSATKALAA